MRGPYDSNGETSKVASLTLDAANVAGMWPILRPGDVVSLDATPKHLRAGDLVAFDDAVQRLVWVDPFEQLWVCADSVGTDPSRRDKREVRGVVTAVVRDGKPVDLPAKRPSRATYVEIALAVARMLKP